jgi:F0F1-type ATP synthase membrane subunit b/b'
MKRLARGALALLLFAGLPALAQSESAGKGEEPGNMAVWAWLNFVLLAGGLGYVIRKNAGPYFARRSREIRKGMIEADEARAEAEAKAAEVDRRLASLAPEIEVLRRDARQEAEAEAEHVRREAALEIAKIQAHMEEEIAAAGKAARLELRRYSARLALGLAEQKIAARMSPEVQDRLLRSFARNLDRPDYRAQSN